MSEQNPMQPDDSAGDIEIRTERTNGKALLFTGANIVVVGLALALLPIDGNIRGMGMCAALFGGVLVVINWYYLRDTTPVLRLTSEGLSHRDKAHHVMPWELITGVKLKTGSRNYRVVSAELQLTLARDALLKATYTQTIDVHNLAMPPKEIAALVRDRAGLRKKSQQSPGG